MWLDRSTGYSLSQFYEDVGTKIIWGPSQTLALWVLDTDTGSEWRIRKDEQWQVMMQEKWDERVAHITMEIVTKHGYEVNASSGPSKGDNTVNTSGSGVTNVNGSSSEPNAEGVGDTFTSPPQPIEEIAPIDWSLLTIITKEEDKNGDVNAIADEEVVYEAMGFRDADERGGEGGTEEIPIPAMDSDLQRAMDEAVIPVDDKDPTEPVYDWDRDNPDMSLGTHYLCMSDLRLAVRHHAIMNEFELGTEKSDTTRFRGFCK